MGKKIEMKKQIEDVQPIAEVTEMAYKAEGKEEVKAKKEVKHYENAHLVMFCGQCNSRYILEENIEKGKGVTINLPPTSEAEMVLVCKDCGNKMGIFYVEAAIKESKEEVNKERTDHESLPKDSKSTK
jgi:transcription initiation factor IIE alpha subunit